MPGHRSRAAETERPFDPDELPIEAEQTEEEREFTAALPAVRLRTRRRQDRS